MLKRYLDDPNSTWDEERSASMRFIARAYREKRIILNQKNGFIWRWLETPNAREPYVERAQLSYLEIRLACCLLLYP